MTQIEEEYSMKKRERPSSPTLDISAAEKLYLRKKEFQVRESPLTVVLQNSSEAKAVYSIAASQLFLFILYSLMKYIIEPKVYRTDMQFLSSQLSGFGAFFDSWIKMHAALILAIYPSTKLWMHYQCKYSAIYALSLIPPFVFILIHPVYTLLENKFLYLLTFSMTVEQVRILMKTISFIVENHRKVVRAMKRPCSVNNNRSNNNDYNSNCKKGSSDFSKDTAGDNSRGFVKRQAESENAAKYHIPRLNQLIYFLFAPTLIYRDEYPRSANEEIRWSKAASLLTEFMVMNFLGLRIVNQVTTPRMMKVGLETLTYANIVDDYIMLTMLAVLCTFGLGYSFLHCWLNAWAEVLRFGDREFYKDWWTSSNFSQFWRRWNGVVQPWIYEYLYKPMIYFTNGNRSIATLSVFLVSAIVHEHVTGFALGGLLPMFGLAMLAFCPFIVAFHFLHNLNDFHSSVFVYTVNWIIWSTTLYGYGLEAFSRTNCPLPRDAPLIELIKPRVLSCVHVE